MLEYESTQLIIQICNSYNTCNTFTALVGLESVYWESDDKDHHCEFKYSNDKDHYLHSMYMAWVHRIAALFKSFLS